MLCDPVRIPQHLVGVSVHPGPSELANAIDDFGLMTASAEEKVATVHDEVRADLFQIPDHGLERREVGMDGGDHGDSHVSQMRLLIVEC